MLRVIFGLLVLCTVMTASMASPSQTSSTKPIKRVIYITLDGVRWQDVFLDHNRLPLFWAKYAKSAAIYGDPQSNITMEVASIPVSLPSYQSQMSGAVQPCKNNECGRLQAETFPEKLVNKLGLKRKDVASISCWEVMDFAVERTPGTIFSNHGTRPMHDPDTMEDDPVMVALNKQQAAAYPGDDTRPDKYTFAQAMHYLEKYKPVFLWISLGDTDDAAHEAHLKAYHNALAFGDQAIDQLMQTLKRMKLDKDTMVIITTDHGRGDGDKWSEHDEQYPEAKQTWAFVINGKLTGGVKDGNMEHYSTLSIRPTIESYFGLNI
jgi:predicted AlkP superfamily pyrophosphatase or phosphodiesterase